jgi:hypothetical protein
VGFECQFMFDHAEFRTSSYEYCGQNCIAITSENHFLA